MGRRWEDSYGQTEQMEKDPAGTAGSYIVLTIDGCGNQPEGRLSHG